jgi:hypothetical protein
MSRQNRFTKQSLLHPEIYQSQLLAAFAQGRFVERDENISPFLRAQIISFDAEGGMLENPDGSGTSRSRNPTSLEYSEINARVGPKNPARSVRARILDIDRYVRDEDLRVYWPMFPHGGIDPTSLEFVYVWFEDADNRHGLWISQVAGPMGEQTNFSPGVVPYQEVSKNNSGRLAAAHGDTTTPSTDYGTNESITGAPIAQSKKNLNYE